MIDHVLIPSSATSETAQKWDRVTDPTELYRCILDRNKGQLLKALDSPFATGPLANSIRRDGSGQTTEHLLDGTINTDFISQVDNSTEMANFIRALQRPISKITGLPVQELTYNLNDETYRKIYAKAREKTSSSPSGIHYGHYMAACQDDHLTSVNATFMRVPFYLDFHWKYGVLQCNVCCKRRICHL